MMRIRVAPPTEGGTSVRRYGGKGPLRVTHFPPYRLAALPPRHAVHQYDAIDTPLTRWGDATIGVAGGGKNRLGSECCWGGLKCRFDGTKSEQRFKSRHTADVSIRR